jgi:DNA-binding XRE family transcriptional regulator
LESYLKGGTKVTPGFSDQLKKLRLEHSYTQKDVAEQLHVSRQTVSSWETGRNTPDLETTKQLAKLYNVTTDTLLSFNSKSKVTQSRSLATSLQVVFWVTITLLIVGRLSLLNTKAGLFWFDLLICVSFVLHFSIHFSNGVIRRTLLPIAHGLLGGLSVLSIWLNIFPAGFEGFQIDSFVVVAGILLFAEGILLWKIERPK